jgi:gamma-glutamylputrescine oxidase
MSRQLWINDTRGAYPPSWYAASTPLPAERDRATGHLTTDVVVIGAGYTGLHAALTLRSKGLDVVVLDAHRVGWGASGRNGGQVGTDFNKDVLWLEKRLGRDTTHALWSLAGEANKMVRDFCRTHAPEANFRDGIAHGETSATDLEDTQRLNDHLVEHYDAKPSDILGPSEFAQIVKTDRYQGGEIDWQAGHVHPLRYVLALAEKAEQAGAQIFENSYVTRIDHGARPRVITDMATVTCDHVILAGNGYIGGLEPKVAARVMPFNSFIGATKPLGDMAQQILTRDIAVCDSTPVVNYFRLSEDGRLLFGGRSSYAIRFPRDIHAGLNARMAAMFPQIAGTPFDYAWGGTLGMTISRLPHLTKVAPNILSGSGFSGHGVALAGLAGRVMAEAIAGQAGRFETLSTLPVPMLPLGPFAQGPLLSLAMTWYALRDKLGH